VARPIGHVSIHLDAGVAELVEDQAWQLGALGIEQRSSGVGDLELLISTADPAELILAIAANPNRVSEGIRSLGIVSLDPDEWIESWKPWARPIDLGPMVIAAPWVDVADRTDPDVPVIRIDPGAAWGHGAHPTTRLVLDWLVGHRGAMGSLLDVGAGSGVLGIVAAQLGWYPVTAIDVDPASGPVVRANAAANRSEVQFDHRTLAQVAEGSDRWDAVLANVDAAVLDSLRNDLATVAAPSGVLVLSGVLAERMPAILDRFSPWTPRSERQLDGWALVELSRSAP